MLKRRAKHARFNQSISPHFVPIVFVSLQNNAADVAALVSIVFLFALFLLIRKLHHVGSSLVQSIEQEQLCA
jgi:hypothetical protein